MLHKHRISLIATAQIRTAYTIYIIYTRAHPQSLHHNPQPTQRNDRAKSQTWHTSRSVRIADKRIRLLPHETQRLLETIAQALRCITPSEYRLAHPFHRNASPPHEDPHAISNLEASAQEFRNTDRTSEEGTPKTIRNILKPKSSIHKYYTLRQQSPATPRRRIGTPAEITQEALREFWQQTTIIRIASETPLLQSEFFYTKISNTVSHITKS